MATKDIEKLLERYYDGQTSEEEEALIAGFFRDGDVPDSLKAEQDFFMTLHGCKTTPLAERLDHKLGTQIDAWSKKADSTGRHTARPAPCLRNSGQHTRCGFVRRIPAQPHKHNA